MSVTRAMLLGVLALAGCGGADDGGGASIAFYHLEAQIRGPVDGGGDVTCDETAVVCPGAGDDEPGPRAYAVAGDPALTDDEVVTERAQALVADVGGEAAVMLDLTSEGATAFHELTRTLANLGRERGTPQHIAIVVDDEIVSWPVIDYQEYPDGLTGDTGVQMIVATVDDAQRLAREIRGGDE